MNSKHHFRSSPRPQVACKIVLYRVQWSSDSPVVAYTRDMGIGGLFAETDEQFEVGQSVDVVIATPSTWDPLVLHAEVRWTEGRQGDNLGGVGLNFVGLTEEQTMALTRFAESLDFEK